MREPRFLSEDALSTLFLVVIFASLIGGILRFVI